MPPLLRQVDRDAFATQLAAYVSHAGLKHCVVVLHGGEPLLMGSGELAAFARQLRSVIGTEIKLDVSVQTNGMLLTPDSLAELAAADIGVSLSLDGPKEINDLHRVSRRGRSSFEQTLRGLEALKANPDIFAGVIAVIDPRSSPRDLLEFFDKHAVPRLDFLLPDAHYLRPPVGRDMQPDVYERWLIEAFDVWFDDFPHVQLRTFEALLDAVAGMPSQTDAFGFGDVSLITIETDGSYHDLDVLKVVAHGATRLSGTVQDTAISDVARSPALAAHRALLRREGLSETCQQCNIVEICGGGAVPHRYGPNGFKNPTVYCSEMRSLIEHVRSRVTSALAASDTPTHTAEVCLTTDQLADFERAETSADMSAKLLADAALAYADSLRQALQLFATESEATPGARSAKALLKDRPDLHSLAMRPGTVAWSRAMLTLGSGRSVLAVDGTIQRPDVGYIDEMRKMAGTTTAEIELHASDTWLRKPFGDAIYFEAPEVARVATARVNEALAIIETWRPAVARELRALCQAIQFVRDPDADPDKIVSFSDNVVPGALYVSVMQRDQLVDAYDLADSLIHEYRHQKLYLLERLSPMVEQTSKKVRSPWREDLRPPSGLFHAIFVFVELRRFWLYVQSAGVNNSVRRRASNQLTETNAHLDSAFKTLENCSLTRTGRSLAIVLKNASTE